MQDAINSLYSAYREGKAKLGNTEAEQFGLRVAAGAGLKTVHAVDWNGLPPGEQGQYDWFAYGKDKYGEEWAAKMRDPARSPFPPLRGQSIIKWLRTLNTPSALAKSHRFYFDIAEVGLDDSHQGANWVGSWYARNLKIFGNITKLADSAEDRVLVVYGAGHAYLIRQFAEESGAFRVIDVADVLTDTGD